MEGLKFCLLVCYGLFRTIPFVITTYLLFGVKTDCKNDKALEQKIQKTVAFLIGIGVNALLFLGMHYCHYKNFNVIGYIKNIWGLNFYHQDVEYFAMSAFAAIFLSVIAGIVLRLFFCDSRTTWTFTKKQEHVVLSAGCAAFVILFAGLYVKDYFQSKIVINEICSNNRTAFLDENEKICDYIELYNTGIFPCQIDDLYLSDDSYELQKKALKGLVVYGKGVLLVPCEESIDSFSINKKGETIYLSDGSGRILETVTTGEMDEDIAYVKTDAATGEWEIGACSPGVDNEVQMAAYVEVPVLSHESGFYETSFELELSAEEDAAIYYTLDGSVPDEGSYLYEDTITVYDKSEEPNVWRSLQNVVPDWLNYTPDERPVTKAFIVRALAVDSAGNKSDVVTASYFIDCEKYKDKNVISLIADPEDLFSDEKGIYVTGAAYDEWYLNGQEGDAPTPLFKMSGMESEREAVFELFCELECVMQQNVGIRIQGASAREVKEKRFSVFARTMYDDSDRLAISFFERDTQPHSVVLRDIFADVLCQDLMEDRRIPMQQGEKIRLFLNGEYWYDSYIREKYSSQYFEDYYGIEEDQLVLYKSGTLDEGVESDALLYNELYRYVQEEDFSKQETYEKFCEMIDVSNYIDFLAANIYCANMDLDDIKNVIIWRSREVCDEAYADGKWRWALYDMDAVEWVDHEYYGISETAAVDSFSVKPQYAASAYDQNVIFLALSQNEEFRKQFVLTFMDLMNENFSVKNVQSKLEEYGENITWQESFFVKRPEYMKTYLAKEFGLTGSVEEVILYNETETEGRIRINSIVPAMENGSWSGEYFTDYPLEITAIPADGYRFVGWSGSVDSTEETVEVNVTSGGIELKTEFEKIE